MFDGFFVCPRSDAQEQIVLQDVRETEGISLGVIPLPETNSEFTPENRGPLESRRFQWETIIFRGKLAVSFREGK